MTMTDTTLAPDTKPRPSAEVFPFPLRATSSWRWIAAEYMRRPDKGRYNKADYAAKVIAGNVDRLTALGVRQDRIDAEIASLERLFYSLTETETEKQRA